MAAPPRPPTMAPARVLPAAAPISAPPPAPMTPPVNARSPGVSPQATVASTRAAQRARYERCDMSRLLVPMPCWNEEGAALAGQIHRRHCAAYATAQCVGRSSVARRRRRAYGGATQAADDGAREGMAGRGANQCTATGADRTAGQRALPGSVSAGGGCQRQCGADGEICESRHELLLMPMPVSTKKSTYSCITAWAGPASPNACRVYCGSAATVIA